MLKFKKILIANLALCTLPIVITSCSKPSIETYSASIINDDSDGFILSNTKVLSNQKYSAYIQSNKFVFDESVQISVLVDNKPVSFKHEVDVEQPTILYIEVDQTYTNGNITIGIDTNLMQYHASLINPITDGYTLIDSIAIKHRRYEAQIISNTAFESDNFVVDVTINSQSIPFDAQVDLTDKTKAFVYIDQQYILGDIEIELQKPQASWAITNGLPKLIAKKGYYGDSGDFNLYLNGSKISRADVSVRIEDCPTSITVFKNIFHWNNEAPSGTYKCFLSANYKGQKYECKEPFLFTIQDEVDFCTDDWEKVCAASKSGLEDVKKAYNMTSFLGLTRKIDITNLGTYNVKIIGINHDLVDSTSLKKATFTFELEEVLPDDKIFDDGSTKSGGYWMLSDNPSVLSNYLNDSIMPLLPNTLQESILPVWKESCVDRELGNVSAFKQSLWIPSATELNYQEQSLYACDEGTLYEYYNIEYIPIQPGELLKHKINSETSVPYWTRSNVYFPESNSISSYFVDSNELLQFQDIEEKSGVIFAFCI